MTEALGNVSVRGQAAVSRSVGLQRTAAQRMLVADVLVEVVSLGERRRKLVEGSGGRGRDKR